MESNKVRKKRKGAAVLFFFVFISIIGLDILSAWLLCNIDPLDSYGWFSGFWHGTNFVANWLRGLFADVAYIAEGGSGAYNFFFWVSAIFGTIGKVLLTVILLSLSLAFLFPVKEKNEETSTASSTDE